MKQLEKLVVALIAIVAFGFAAFGQDVTTTSDSGTQVADKVYAAQIGETKYETLDAAMLAAFASASDVTVTVLSDGDYTLNPTQYIFNMMFQKTVTLNLNDANVTMKADMSIFYGNKLVITGDGTMTFENGGKLRAMYMSSSTGGDKAAIVIEGGTFVNKTDKHVIIEDYCGSLTVNGSTFSAAADVPVIAVADSTGHVELNGGTYPASALLVNTKTPDVTKTAGLAVTAPEGYYWKDDTTLTVGSLEPAYAAQIGETKYETLDAAWDAASGTATITLLADASLTPSWKVVFGDAPDITIDLNGHKLDATSAENEDAVFGLTKGKLTVKNGELTVGTLIGGGNAEIVVENATVKGNMDPNGGTLTLVSGDFSGATLTTQKSATVTKTAGLAVTAPADYYWKDDTTLTAKVYVASIVSADGTATNKYETVDAAVSAAKDDETLTVLSKDAELPSTLPEGVTVVLGTGVEAPAAPDGYKWDETGTLVKDILQPEVSVTGAFGGNATMVTEDGGMPEVGSVVTLKATPEEGYTFAGWSGDMVSLDAETSMTIPEKEKVEVTANFLPTEVFVALTNQVVTTYVKDNNLVSVDSIRELSAQNPTITVEKDENNNPIADVGIQLMRTSTLSGKGRSGTPNWTPITKADFIDAFYDEESSSIRFRIPADANAQFFRFVPVNGLRSPTENDGE